MVAPAGSPEEPAPGDEASLDGELHAPPASPLSIVLLGCSGVLLLSAAARLIGRLALAYRHPARLELTEHGIRLTDRVELLGRVVRQRETVVPLSDLTSVTREVRYARAGLYAGLLALVLGTYLGTGLLLDGLRAPGGSGSLLLLGLGLAAGGLVLDFTLSTLWDNARRTCRIVIARRTGRALCLAGVDPARAAAILGSVARTEAYQGA